MSTRRLFILTGASRGLGAAMARQLLAADTHLLTLSRHPDPSLARRRRAERRAARAVGARPLPRHRLGRPPGNLAAPARPGAVYIGDADQQRRTARTRRPDRAQRRRHDRGRAARRARSTDAACGRVPPCDARMGDRQAGPQHLVRRGTARDHGLGGVLRGQGGRSITSPASPRRRSAAPNPARIVSLAPGVIDTDMQGELRAADAAGFPEQTTFIELKRRGQLPSPDAAAARVLAYLARADFGRNRSPTCVTPREHDERHRPPATAPPARSTRTRSSRNGAPSSPRCAAKAPPFRTTSSANTTAGTLQARYGELDREPLAQASVEVVLAGRMMLKRVMGKASFATIQDSTGRHPVLRRQRRHRRSGARGVQALGHRRHRRRAGRALQDAEGRTVGALQGTAAAREVAASAARQVPRPGGPRAAVPPALRRPDHQRGDARRVRDPQQGDRGDAPVHGRRGLSRSRDADAAGDPGRRRGQALRHASQRARHRHVPAHRAGTVPEAPRGRRLRPRVRDQPQLPQRGAVAAPQPRVHDDGVLRRVPGVPVADGLHRAAAAARGHRGDRHRGPGIPGPDHRPVEAVRATDHRAGDPPARRAVHRGATRRPRLPAPRTARRRAARTRRKPGSVRCSWRCSRKWPNRS